MVFVRIDEDGKPRPIHKHVKERFKERKEKFGKGLLTPEEKFRIGSEI
jgi:acyl-CoA hydrolase